MSRSRSIASDGLCQCTASGLYSETIDAAVLSFGETDNEQGGLDPPHQRRLILQLSR